MGLTLYHYIIIWKLVQLYCLNSGGNYAPGRTGLHLEQPSHPAEPGSAEDFPLWQNWQKRGNQGILGLIFGADGNFFYEINTYNYAIYVYWCKK